MRFVSHLDLIRIFQRAARRAGLPLELTKGFHPHPKMQFQKALKLGIEGEKQEFILYLNSQLDTQRIKSLLQTNLPEGIFIENVEKYE
jgi:radical SAM-linked protein